MDTHSPQTDPNSRPSYQQHRRQRFWQIVLPVGLAVILMGVVLALVILTATGGDPNAQVSVWADTSMILLLLPVILVAVLAAVVLFGLVYLLGRLLNLIPSYAGIVQKFVGTVAEKVRVVSDAIAKPFIDLRGKQAAANRIFTRLGKIFHG